jgi:DNA-binding GntR family transcriptional regulator
MAKSPAVKPKTKQKPEILGMPAEIADKVRDLVVRGTLSPGEHLGQAELAERFGVSRMPVREALKLLAADGVVSHDPNRGYFIARLSRAEATELYKMRRWLEAELLGSMPWPTARQIVSVRALLDEVDGYLMAGDWSKWNHGLDSLRRAIFDLSAEKYILQEALRLWTLTDRYRLLMPPMARVEDERAGSGERALLDAMVVQDRPALLTAYHKDRDRIEAILFESLDQRML